MSKRKPNLPAIFGQVLKSLRLEKGWSQQDLANNSDVDRVYISKIERGISAPSIIIFAKLAKVFQLEPHELMEMLDNEMKKKA